jgi:putative membrane protein
MLLKKNLSIGRILRITWKIDLIMFGSCCIAHFVDVVLYTHVQVPPALPTLIGTALAFFIGFNNNQAYSRWWEARTIWGGIVNESRSWARNVLNYCTFERSGMSRAEITTLQKYMIKRHIGFVYALKSSLRKRKEKEYEDFLSHEDIEAVAGKSNIPNAILDLQAADLERLFKANAIDGFKLRILNKNIESFCDEMGKSERINNTVFPTTYVYFTRIFIWVFVIMATMAISDTTGAWSIMFGWILGFIFHVSHVNGMTILNPFEYTPAAISLDSISRTIEINLLESMGSEDIPAPVQPINHEFLM